ncbi:MAG: hypothetical protein R6V45_05495 [Oceanipulchritudo sp.]
MIRLLVIYLLLAAIGLSFWHSYRVIRISKEPGASVNAILQARREKGLLLVGGSVAFAYSLTILFFSIFWGMLTPLVILTPFLYLAGWSLPRLFLHSIG